MAGREQFRLNIEGADEDVPRLLLVYGKGCGGEVAFVFRPRDSEGVLIHQMKGQPAQVWVSNLAQLPEGVRPSNAGKLNADGPQKPAWAVGASEAVSLVKRLKATGQQLKRAQALLPARPKDKAEAELVVRYAEMKGLYDAILNGLGLNAVELEAEAEIEAGFIPASVVLVIGALGLTAAGVAWAIANYEYAKALRDQSTFLVKELEARQESMRTGKALPDGSGYPEGSGSSAAAANKDKKPKDKDEKGWGWLWALLGVGALTGAAIYGPKLLKGR